MGDVIEILTTATNTVEVEAQGPQGIPGVGVPTGGSALQVLRKKTSTDYDTEWAAAGSGSGSVTSVALASTDLTISGSPITDSGTITANIAANAVTLEKLQTISSEHLLGRHGSGNGGVQTIGLGTGLAMSGSNVRVATTGITAGTYTKLTIDETGRATVGETATPSDIAAQPLPTRESLTITGNTTLAAARYKIYEIAATSGTVYDLTLPSNNAAGDIVALEYGFILSNSAVTIKTANGSPVAVFNNLRRGGFVFRNALGTDNGWLAVPVSTHQQDLSDAGQVTGLLGLASGGLQADVSAYNGLVKISGGSTSAVGIGTGSTEVAAGDHGHGNITSDGKLGSVSGLPVVTTTAGAVTTLALGTANQVLRVNSGASGVEFADPAASGVTGAASSASDVLGVSGSDITGVDATADRIVFWDDSASKLAYLEAGSGLSLSGTTLSATGGGVTAVNSTLADILSVSGSDLVADDGGTIDSADPFIKWDDAAGKLVYANPLSRPTGSFYVGLAPTTTALGTDAVNIQPNRSAATRVSSGLEAIAIGNSAIASNVYGIAIGRNASSTGGGGSMVVGPDASCAGTASITLGYNSSCAGNDSMTLGNGSSCAGNTGTVVGRAASCSQSGGVAIGYVTNTTAVNATGIGNDADASLRGQFVTRPFSAIYWGGTTTNDTPLILNLDATATNRFTIAASTALAVDIMLVARRSDTQDKWLVARRFLGIRRDGSNNTSLIGAVQTLGTDQSEGSPSWTFALTADDTNEALQLEVTGATSETVVWRATAFYRVA